MWSPNSNHIQISSLDSNIPKINTFNYLQRTKVLISTQYLLFHMMQTSISQFNFRSVNWVFNFCGQVYHVEGKLFSPPDGPSNEVFRSTAFPTRIVISRITGRYVQRTHDNDQIEMRTFFEGSKKNYMYFKISRHVLLLRFSGQSASSLLSSSPSLLGVEIEQGWRRNRMKRESNSWPKEIRTEYTLWLTFGGLSHTIVWYLYRLGVTEIFYCLNSRPLNCNVCSWGTLR